MALDDPINTQFALAESAISSDVQEDWGGPWPTRFVIRTIDLVEVQVAVGGQVVTQLQAFFRNHTLAQALPATGIAQAIKDAVGGSLVPVASSLAESPRTPLDLEVKDEPLYIVFILGKPSNMTFNPLRKAISHKNLDDRDRYGNLRHVKATATSYEEDEEGLSDCRIAYFVAYPPAPPASNYKHGFNLNVRLLQPPNLDGSPRWLDIQIDPDVRYPGGSGT
ncbi:MAG TPA: nucleotide synthetase [Allosphingosinicella sp.]|nr:nucleotide synthetase [Allosphingosinicella sp.]